MLQSRTATDLTVQDASACECRFCITAWLAMKRSREEVEALMAAPERTPDALKRVQQLVRPADSLSSPT